MFSQNDDDMARLKGGILRGKVGNVVCTFLILNMKSKLN